MEQDTIEKDSWPKNCLKKKGILLAKLFGPTVRKKCSSDSEKLLKLEAETF